MLDETSLTQRLVAEVLGTAFLVFIGVGSVPATLIVNGNAPFTMADLGMISLAFGTVVVATVVRVRPRRGQPHQPGGDAGLAVIGQVPLARRCRTTSPHRSPVRCSARWRSSACWAIRPATSGSASPPTADISWTQAFVAEFVGTFILVFTVFGVIHRKAAAGLRRRRDRAGRVRRDHPGGAGHRRVDQPRPHVRPDARPAARGRPRAVEPAAGVSASPNCSRVSQPPSSTACSPAPRPTGRPRPRDRPRRPRPAPSRASTPDRAHRPRRRSHEEAHQRPAERRRRGAARASRPRIRSCDVDHQHKIIYRGDAPRPGKVGLISGGGSGHEPLHGGFVGLGMLDAACAGEVFTSPVPDQMLAATKLVDGGAGVLHIVKNYTGDVMNFEMAAELAAAESGAEVVSVVTDDDVAVQDSTWTAGRRGVGVTVLLEKIAGAAAEQGRPLEQVADVARQVNANGRSMGMALTSCTVPAAGKPTFELAEDEMELGVGIHGEPGRQRVPLAPAARDRRDAGRADPGRPAVHRRRRGDRVRQRPGRHAADRALRDVQRGEPDPRPRTACRWPARWSAPTSPRWTWPAAR